MTGSDRKPPSSTPEEVMAEIEASGWVCPNCSGSGFDQTWHEGAPCAEVHQCGYCMGFTCKPDSPSQKAGSDTIEGVDSHE